MIEWWTALPADQQIFAGLGIGFGSLLFGLMLLALLGTDLDADADTDIDLDTSSLFSIKGILSFLTFFGAGGFLMLRAGFPLWSAGLVGALFGYAIMSALIFMLGKLKALDATGNRDASALLGQEGRVYLHIPAKGDGVGRVELLQSGRLVELEARSNGAAIQTGDDIRVLEVLEGGQVLVEPLAALPPGSV